MRNILFIVFILSLSITLLASENRYDGPTLNSAAYKGSVMIDNSWYRYTAGDRLSFFTADFLRRNHPELLPLRPAIDTWASRHNVHPRLLSLVVRDYFGDRRVTGDRSEMDDVAQLAAALDAAYRQQGGHVLAATRAVVATSHALGFEVNLPEAFLQRRAIRQRNGLRKGGNPTLFGYFQPPWEIGESWAGGGAHGDTGDGLQNALDFWGTYQKWGEDTSPYKLAAMQSGTVRVWSSCGMAIIHADGWVTDYYHLDNITVSDMQAIERNTPMADYADNFNQATCTGGSSSGPHVHMGITWNGNRVSVDETEIDFTAFSHHVGVGQYDSNCATSYYTHFNDGTICPFYTDLLNDAPVPGTESLIFTDGFESGDLGRWQAP